MSKIIELLVVETLKGGNTLTVSAFFEQQKVCPICQTKVTVTRVRSSACFVTERETDFHVKYRDINPLLYSIWVCPNCQYANNDKDFNQEFQPHEIARLTKGLTLLKSEEPDLSGQRTPQSALRAVELAIRTAMVRQAPAIQLAGFYLRGAWFFRNMGKTEDELKYLDQARKLYQHSFEKEWRRYAAKMSDSRIMYLIGELFRRLGDNEEAIKWFSRTVMNKDIKNEPEINRLVRDQWEIAREDYRKQQAGQPKQPANKEVAATDSAAPEKTADLPVEKTAQAAQSKPRGSKVKMFLSLYIDQVDWLKQMASKSYDKHKVFMEKEMVARAIIDAVMEKFPDLGDFKSEEELKQIILAKFASE